MLINDRTLAGEIVHTMASEGTIERILILDGASVVQVSSNPVEVGGRYEPSQPECQFCHASSQPPVNQTKLLTLPDGSEALVNVDVIRNKPQCNRCHSQQSTVLGHLLIEMPLTDLHGQLAAGFWRMALSGLATFLALAVLMAFAVRRLIGVPVRSLVTSVAQISAGNLDQPVRVSSSDELGDLANSFDEMRMKLKASRADMERRNRELSVLNEVALAASQLLDLQQILDLALEMVVSRLGLESGTIHILDPDSGTLALRAYRGMTEAESENAERSRQSAGGDLSQQVADSGDALFVPNMAGDDRFRDRWPDPEGRSYVNVPLKSEGRVVGTMGLFTPARQPLCDRDVQVLKSVGHEIGIAIDNALLVAQTRRGEHEATTLYLLGTQVTSSLELGQVLDAVADGARILIGADIGVVGLMDAAGQAVVLKAASGARTEGLRGVRIPLSEELRGSALISGQPIIVEDRWRGLSMRRESDPIAAEGVVSFLAVPLRRGEQLLGLVGAMTRTRRHFTQDDVRLLMRLASQVTVAVENAQLYEQVRHLVTLKERDWLARELHDGLAQALAFLNLKASLIGEQLSANEVAHAKESLVEFKQVTQATYADVREAIFGLHSPLSSGQGLLVTVQEFLEEYEAHYGLAISLFMDIDDGDLAQFPPGVASQMLRIVQEALSNVRKHAKVGVASVRFEHCDDGICIIVEDSGRGFDPGEVVGEGSRAFGLQIMRERAESVGATLQIESQPGVGTRVVVRLPSSSPGRRA